MTKQFDPSRYARVPGDPAFPPPSIRREEAYIEKMIRRDALVERQDNTVPTRKEK